MSTKPYTGTIFSPVCPRCGETKNNISRIKSWELKGGLGKQDFIVHLYQCGRCGKRFRKLERIKTERY